MRARGGGGGGGGKGGAGLMMRLRGFCSRHHWFPCEMTSFRGEAVDGVAKCRLVSQATESSDSQKSVVFAGYPYGG